MPEDSFTDRIQRAELLHNTINLLTPAYNPGVPGAGELDLQINAFFQKVAQTAVVNEAAEDAATAYGNWSTNREAHLTNVLAAATSVLAYLRSKKKTLAPLLTGAEKIVKRMRGSKAKKAPPPPDGEPPPPDKVRSKGQQSYMEQQGHLRTLVNLLTNKPGYAPPASPPGQPPHPASLDNLNALLSAFRTFNAQSSILEAALIHAEAVRMEAFEHKDHGLHPWFLAMKEAVQSQYGFTSSQYEQIAGIEW